MIIMMCGLPVSGKSTIAQSLQDNNLGIIIKSVLTRDPSTTITFTNASIDETIPKTKKEKDDSYKRLIELAEEEVLKGNNPILDATFHKHYRRQWVYNLCKRTEQKLLIILCQWDDESGIRRVLDARRQDKSTKDNVLDTWEQYMIMKTQNEHLTPDEMKSAVTCSLEKKEEVIDIVSKTQGKQYNSQLGF